MSEHSPISQPESGESGTYSIETEHLHMRPIRTGDEALIFPEVDTELTKHWIGWEPTTDIDDVRKDIEVFEKNPQGVRFMVFNKETKEFIGNGNLLNEEGEYQLELWIKASMQGRGYGKEILDALIGWAKTNLDVLYVVYSVTDGNISSQALIQKLGLNSFREFDVEKRGETRHVRDYQIALR